MYILDKILQLTKLLYPKGRAFKMPFQGVLDQLNQGLAESEYRFHTAAYSILYDILPDTTNFDTDDCAKWERNLGLITNINTSLSDRRLGIKRKLQYPGTQVTRCNYLFIEQQLQTAGFNVTIHENRFFEGGQWIVKSPDDILGTSSSIEHGQFEHGQFEHGGSFWGKTIVTYIEQLRDLYYQPNNNLRSSFFIGGATLGTYASIPKEREAEFRQMVLRLKPTQTYAYLFINYV